MTDDVKLYANKFKTVEDLEEGYRNSLPTFQENEKLKKQVEDLTKLPDTYLNPSDVELDTNRISDIQSRAKEAGLTQAQYEKFVRSDKARVDANQARFEASRKEVGEETINVLKDYVNKHYPKELSENILNTFIQNKEARAAALNHRQQLLSNQIPGFNKPAVQSYTVTDEDVKKAYKAKEDNKGDMKARNHYLNLIAAQAAQKNSD